MNSLVKTFGSINIIEDYISKDTCDFLINIYNDSFTETPNKGILGGPSQGLDYAWTVGPGSPFPPYSANKNKNIASDLITNITNSMGRSISNFYSEPVDLRTIFLSKMITGAKLQEHYDNYEPGGKEFYAHGTDAETIDRIGFESDWSALLYLNDEYQGGEIEFPQYDLKLKPKPGTFVFFKGDMDALHFVNEVTGGNRINLITFYWRTEYRKQYFEALASKGI